MEEKECREPEKPQSEKTWDELMKKFEGISWQKPQSSPVTVNIHNDFGPLLEVLLSINQKLNKMSEVNDQINATVDALSTSLDKIKADIATLAGEINPGGLTADEATALQAKLNVLAGKAADIDAQTPDA
jgi:endonuclease III